MAVSYRAVRNWHFWLGLTSAVFLLMYGVSALGMVYSRWLRMSRPQAVESEAQLEPGITNSRVLASELMRRGLITGEIESASSQQLRVGWPMASYTVTYDVNSGAAKILTVQQPWMTLLRGLHHTAGLWHEWWVLQAWNGIVVAASAALIVLGCSGVWMWWKRGQERAVGSILLAVSLVFSVALLILCRAT